MFQYITKLWQLNYYNEYYNLYVTLHKHNNINQLDFNDKWAHILNDLVEYGGQNKKSAPFIGLLT